MFLKTKTWTCAVVGACSVAAPAAVGAYASGAFSGTTLKHEYSPPSPNSLSNTSKASVLGKPYSSCFNSFFPGVKIGGQEGDTGHDGTIADNTVDDGKLIGCALMKLDYTSSSKFAFSAEITAKNGTHGWAIKIYLQTENTYDGAGSNYTYKFTYNIVFLTRDNSSKKWSVEGGIYLEPSSPGSPTANISFPSKPILANNNRDSSISSVTSKTWFSTWEESSNAGAKEIFDDIKVDYDQYNTLYLGKPSSATQDQCSSDTEDNDEEEGDSDNCDCGTTTRMDSKKKYEDRRWNDNHGRIVDVCHRYKAQLKDKKGSWSWHDDPQIFCSDLKSNGATDEVKRKKLNNYCYSYL